MLHKAQQYLRSHRLLAIFTVLILVLLISVVGLIAAFTTRASAQGQNCGGEVQTLNGQLSESGGTAQQAEKCFWHAFQKCSAATLTFEERGLDAGIIHTFTTVNTNGKCSISDATQHYIAPGPDQPGNTYTCTGLEQQTGGLHFLNCGDEGDIVVPLPVAQQCGTVQARANGLVNGVAARQAENCFWQAFQACRAATLVFQRMGVDTVLTRTFTTSSANGTCSISDTVKNGGPDAIPVPARTYTCTGLVQKSDGLHFSACGEDGDIIVAAA